MRNQFYILFAMLQIAPIFGISLVAQEVRIEWSRYYTSPDSLAVAQDMTSYNNGNLYICGYEKSSDYLSIKYSHDGKECWTRSYNNAYDRAYAIVVNRQGDIIVAGNTNWDINGLMLN